MAALRNSLIKECGWVGSAGALMGGGASSECLGLCGTSAQLCMLSFCAYPHLPVWVCRPKSRTLVGTE